MNQSMEVWKEVWIQDDDASANAEVRITNSYYFSTTLYLGRLHNIYNNYCSTKIYLYH
jgi:hypothetical protein